MRTQILYILKRHNTMPHIEVLSSDTLTKGYIENHIRKDGVIPEHAVQGMVDGYTINEEGTMAVFEAPVGICIYINTGELFHRDLEKRIKALAPDVQQQIRETKQNGYEVMFNEEQRVLYQRGLELLIKEEPNNEELKMLLDMTTALHDDHVKLCPNPWDSMLHGFCL